MAEALLGANFSSKLSFSSDDKGSDDEERLMPKIWQVCTGGGVFVVIVVGSESGDGVDRVVVEVVLVVDGMSKRQETRICASILNDKTLKK